MTLNQIKEAAQQLKGMDDSDAYTKGLDLLKQLKQYKNELTRREYKAIEYAIQEERFR